MSERGFEILMKNIPESFENEAQLTQFLITELNSRVSPHGIPVDTLRVTLLKDAIMRNKMKNPFLPAAAEPAAAEPAAAEPAAAEPAAAEPAAPAGFKL